MATSAADHGTGMRQTNQGPLVPQYGTPDDPDPRDIDAYWS